MRQRTGSAASTYRAEIKELLNRCKPWFPYVNDFRAENSTPY